MNVRTFIRAALVAALPAALTAQSSALRPGAFIVSVGAGSGSASFSCDACGGRRDPGLSGLARLGVGLRSNLALSAEASGWTSDYKDPRGTGTARMIFTHVVAQWYPRAGSGGFVKAGGGVASIRDEIRIGQVGNATVTTHNPSFVVGAGWDILARRRWAIAPYVDFNVSTKSAFTVNGVRAANQLGGSLVHVGLAATLR